MLNYESAFKREHTEANTLSSNVYNLMIGLVLLYGFGVNWIMVETIPTELVLAIPKLVFFIGYFIFATIGIWMFSASTNPLVSFIGYNFIVVPIGFVLNIVLARTNPEVVSQAIQTTALFTVAMMVLSTLFPKFFSKLGGVLFWSLLALVIADVIQVWFMNVHFSIVNYLLIGVFCLYIGYDWYRANNIPKTLDNAVDSAASLYLDIINLFLQLLRLFSNR